MSGSGRGSIGQRFFVALFLLSVIGLTAYGLLVARRAASDFAGHSAEIALRSREGIVSILTDIGGSQADLMDRAIGHMSDNIGDELEDIPFDVFEKRQDLLVALLRERLDEARRRHRENARVIAESFRERAAGQLRDELAVFARRQEDATQRWKESISRRLLIWGGAFLLGVSGLIGLAFWLLVLRPLRLATAVIETMRGDDLTQRIPTDGTDEITRLAVSFNAMADEIEVHQRGLQDQVDRQTEALSRALAEQTRTNAALRATVGELERTQHQLVESAKMAALGTMARGMAHEFNNILGGISGCAEDLLQDTVDEDAREVLAVIHRTSRRACVITENLLRFSRGGQRVKGLASVEEILRGAAALVEPEASRKGIRIALELAPVPALVTDAEGLQQVFLNLLINAIQASQSGGRIDVRLESDGAWQRVVVEDHGEGIDPQHLGRVFDPFFTTKDPASGERGGTGLGLSVSLGIVHGLGGRIAAHSEGPGRGSRFSVQIPIEEAEADHG